MKVTIECNCGASATYPARAGSDDAVADAVLWFTGHEATCEAMRGYPALFSCARLVERLGAKVESETARELAMWKGAVAKDQSERWRLESENSTLRQALDDLGPLVAKVPE